MGLYYLDNVAKFFTAVAKIHADAPYTNPILPPPEDTDYDIRYYEMNDSGSIPPTSFIVGFYSPTSASFTFQLSNPSFDLPPVELAAGQFKFALYDKYMYPKLRTPYHEPRLRNIVGKVYAVCADMGYEPGRWFCQRDLYCVADLYFMHGMVGRCKNTVDKPFIMDNYEGALKYVEDHGLPA